MVLTALGEDQAGLVSALSAIIVDHGGNWETSRMARLAGKFAGIVMVTIADERAEALIRDLAPLEEQGLLEVHASFSKAAPPPGRETVHLHLIGLDRPGIVSAISNALATRGVSIEELETETVSAPMDGGVLFKARADLMLPAELSRDDLAGVLDSLTHELALDIELDEG